LDARVCKPATIRTRAGLTEQLAPDLLAPQELRHEPLLLLVGTEVEQGRRAHAQTDAEVQERQVVLLAQALERAGVQFGQALPAVLLRVLDAHVPGVVHRGLELLGVHGRGPPGYSGDRRGAFSSNHAFAVSRNSSTAITAAS
jgi:hypothetical protein